MAANVGPADDTTVPGHRIDTQKNITAAEVIKPSATPTIRGFVT